MLVFSTLLVTLGAPSSDVPLRFQTLELDPPIREVRFAGGKRGRYLVRGDVAGEVSPLTAFELVSTLARPEQAAELVDRFGGTDSLSVEAATRVLSALGAKPKGKLEVGAGASADGLWVARIYAQPTPSGGGALIASRFVFGKKPARSDVELYRVEGTGPMLPSAPPPPPSKAVEQFWKLVHDLAPQK